jgi:hypothetical protein
MKHDSERDQRWMAYLMGEGDPDERAAVEAEMREEPEAAEACRRVMAGVEKWAEEAVPAAPLDFEALYARVEEDETAQRERMGEWVSAPQYGGPDASSPRRVVSNPWVWVAGVAASALLVFALAQVQFTVRFGDKTTLQWGRGADTTDLAALRTQLETVASEAHESRLAAQSASTQIQTVSQRSSLMQEEFRQATAGLAWMQRAESQQRYRDVETLMRLTGVYPSANEWTEASGETRKQPFLFPEKKKENEPSSPDTRIMKTGKEY